MRRMGWVGVGMAVLLAVAAAGWAAWAARRPPPEKPPVTLVFSPAEVARPQRVALPRRIEFSGPLVAPQTAVVRAKSGGTLTALAVGEGDRVRAGQRLGTVELADLSTRLAERAAAIDAARARLAQAERTYASSARLADQGFISTNALDGQRTTLEAAQAELRAAQAQADTVRVAVRDGALVAPIDGIVSRRQALPGEKLSAEQPVLTLVDIARLEMVGAVGTHEVSNLAPGMTVEVTVEGLDRQVEGRVARIAPAAEPGTRSIAVAVAIDNPREVFRAGQFAIARATLGDDTPRLTVPLTAVGQTAGQDHVWVIEGGTLARRVVTLGRRDPAGGRVEVLQGLAPDATVLAVRFDNLREGAPARVAAGAPLPASVAASPAVAAASSTAAPMR